ncbi:hypothetical protein Afil01_67460 [Actinorhabdospora filicis]|uniref:LTD domain-containing protein n=1 Tax=Actinorhabdospora filicis TaxID=1785913 RepID=A0A9W6SU08_9ACTN|nr:lamin tail domain-containing protein [Actinorhabdospora filicis]GLZ81939.1 hypothetical protein Afil01_67460 [Actinorhabdospora filicis]
MRKLLALAASAGMILALGVAGTASASADSGTDRVITPKQSMTVVINEVQTHGLSAGDQFVELRNVSPNSIDLAGYQLLRCETSGNETVIQTFGPGTVLAPYGQIGQHLLIAPSAVKGVAPDVIASPSISQQGGAILRTPFNNGGQKVDGVGFSPLAGSCLEQTNASGPAASVPVFNTWNLSAQRNHTATDTDTNSIDFGLITRSPQNRFSV